MSSNTDWDSHKLTSRLKAIPVKSLEKKIAEAIRDLVDENGDEEFTASIAELTFDESSDFVELRLSF
jgi:hypothetical protein